MRIRYMHACIACVLAYIQIVIGHVCTHVHGYISTQLSSCFLGFHVGFLPPLLCISLRTVCEERTPIMLILDAQRAGKSPQNTHISYRDDKLTRLLKDSLGGNSKAVLIANVRQSPEYLSETLSTLRFAQNAKCVVNCARVNTQRCGEDEPWKVEIARLKYQLFEQVRESENVGIISQLRLNRTKRYFFCRQLALSLLLLGGLM